MFSSHEVRMLVPQRCVKNADSPGLPHCGRFPPSCPRFPPSCPLVAAEHHSLSTSELGKQQAFSRILFMTNRARKGVDPGTRGLMLLTGSLKNVYCGVCSVRTVPMPSAPGCLGEPCEDGGDGAYPRLPDNTARLPHLQGTGAGTPFSFV